ncbi:MAG TPA: nitroreductase family protein [Thermotogota bacterium]|nr:nitroreductase family protein [Thermotogota bacterium]
MKEEEPMDFETVVHKRRTVRDFEETAIPAEILKRAISFAFKAPSHNHLRQWDDILVADDAIKLAITQNEGLTDSYVPDLEPFKNADPLVREMYLHAIPKQKRMILSAPTVCVVVYEPKMPVDQATKIYDLNCHASVWCSIENFLLALAEEDVFGVTFIPQNTPGVKRVLGIPENLEVAAIIPIGYENAGYKEIPQKSIRIEERTHRDRW